MYHVLNRANARLPLFEKDEDFAAFERVLAEAVERSGIRLLSYCLMGNHWHLVVWPREDGELSQFASLRRSVNRGCPYGDESWSATAIESLGLEITTRPRGRPRRNGS